MIMEPKERKPSIHGVTKATYHIVDIRHGGCNSLGTGDPRQLPHEFKGHSLSQMLLGQCLPLDHLGLSANLKDRVCLDNRTFKSTLLMTCKYQRQVEVEDCQELTKDIFSSLSCCTSLRHLNLCGTLVESLSFLPSISRTLAVLKLARTQLSDYAGLSSCTQLIYLDLAHTSFSDTSLLTPCTRLTKLDLGGSQVSDVTPLGSLGRLACLYLDGCPVTNVDALKDCRCLEVVNIGFTEIKPEEVDKDIDSEILDVRPRSTKWFSAVFRNACDAVQDIINDCQWVNERVHPQLVAMSLLVLAVNGQKTLGFRCFDKVCHRKTHYFSFEPEVKRPTALHVAAFLGNEVMMKQLMDLRADTSLTCWFGEVQGMNLVRGKQGRDVTVSQLIQLCADHCYWSTTRDHYKRGLNSRKVCAEKAARMKGILQRDPELTDEVIKLGEEAS